MAENLEYVQKGFRILHPMMAAYLAQEMSREYKSGWWQEVLMTLSDQTRDLPSSGEWSELVDSLDIANCIRLLDREWNALFKRLLSIDHILTIVLRYYHNHISTGMLNVFQGLGIRGLLSMEDEIMVLLDVVNQSLRYC